MPSANAMIIEIAREALIFIPSMLLREKLISKPPRCMDEARRDASTPEILPRMLIDGGTRIKSAGR